MFYVTNTAGERVSGPLDSEAEACHWFLDRGRRGDVLGSDDPCTLAGELMRIVCEDLGIARDVTFDTSGAVFTFTLLEVS
jgi:hypothetical protein